MKGYKAFNNDLTCRGMQYEIGKEYVFDGKPIPCKQGFHFCETIADCYEFYPMSDDTRICEVEATGEIAEDGVKRVTNVIKVIGTAVIGTAVIGTAVIGTAVIGTAEFSTRRKSP